ncbi:MAG: hypothetical protein JRD39_03235 [Deltaproteobacteria bacterium]|jgi:hypothetical protein|nr:hypothetical protein [Deltaproteobacteria bacterium]
MLKIFYNKLRNRSLCLLLIGFFLTSFPAGGSAFALCLDGTGNHMVSRNPILAACHPPEAGKLLPSGEYCLAQAEKENNDCTDIALSNPHKLNRPSKTVLSAVAKTLVSYTLPGKLTGLHYQAAGQQTASRFTQRQFPASRLDAHRTVVLLI